MLIGVIFSVIVFIVVIYSFFLSVGYENFTGITIELDEVYENTSKMAYAVKDELKRRGKQCEIIELGNGYPKLLVDGKEYTASYRTASVKSFPLQVIQLRPCK